MESRMSFLQRYKTSRVARLWCWEGSIHWTEPVVTLDVLIL